MRKRTIAKLLWILDICLCTPFGILVGVEIIPFPMWAMWLIVTVLTVGTGVGTYFLSRCPYCHMPLNEFRIFPYAACPYCGNELNEKDS